jgi:hypothetical protein
MRKFYFFFLLLLTLNPIVNAQNRGAISCPEFNAKPPARINFGNNIFNKINEQLNKDENSLKFTFYNGVWLSFSTTLAIHAYDSTGNKYLVYADTSEYFSWGNYMDQSWVLSLEYEQKITNKSSIQFSMGYSGLEHDIDNIASPITYLIDNKMGFITYDAEERSNNLLIGLQYRRYFFQHLRGLYFAPFTKFKFGWTTYNDTKSSGLSNDYDFKGKSFANNTGLMLGNQFLFKQRLLVDLFFRLQYNSALNYNREYLNNGVNEQAFNEDHDNEYFFLLYDTGFRWGVGISLGYRFGKN